jgi:ADP-heptose:LPS heptosyltransferase
VKQETFNFQNILIIDHGQLGDVILSLPVVRALREKFLDSKLTVLSGKSTAEIIKISGLADNIIIVDRVKLRDSNKFWSIGQIFKLVINVRSNKFDLVIDLHSLPETNILVFFPVQNHDFSQIEKIVQLIFFQIFFQNPKKKIEVNN